MSLIRHSFRLLLLAFIEGTFHVLHRIACCIMVACYILWFSMYMALFVCQNATPGVHSVVCMTLSLWMRDESAFFI